MNYPTPLYFAPLAIFYVILSVMAWRDWRKKDSYHDNHLAWFYLHLLAALGLALIGLIKLLNP